MRDYTMDVPANLLINKRWADECTQRLFTQFDKQCPKFEDICKPKDRKNVPLAFSAEQLIASPSPSTLWTYIPVLPKQGSQKEADCGTTTLGPRKIVVSHKTVDSDITDPKTRKFRTWFNGISGPVCDVAKTASNPNVYFVLCSDYEFGTQDIRFDLALFSMAKSQCKSLVTLANGSLSNILGTKVLNGLANVVAASELMTPSSGPTYRAIKGPNGKNSDLQSLFKTRLDCIRRELNPVLPAEYLDAMRDPSAGETWRVKISTLLRKC